MGEPPGPRVKEHNGGGVIEPDTQPLAGKLAFSVKELSTLHQLYMEYIKTEIKKTQKQKD